MGPEGGALGPPRAPKMGPGTPGIDFKSLQKIAKFSKILAGSINCFGFSVFGVFLNSFFFHPWEGPGPPRDPGDRSRIEKKKSESFDFF